MKRICVYPKDVAAITGRSERTGCNILKKLKIKLNKTKGQYVSLEDLCTELGIDFDKVVVEFYGK